ncbi:MAG TPA: hypothetical protein VE056_02295 [Pyrinomonadaceae bacterium]|nr:hypothetical protein [Pyrinomonadaceae bacterium]
MDDTRSHYSRLEWLIVGSCAVFIFILALSAVYDRSIRVLHAFQALIYVAVVILVLRRSVWGYGAGCIIAAFWNWTNIVHTTFVANGLHELAHALQTGRVSRPDQLIAVVAATAHFTLIGSCLVGYFRIKPRGPWEPVKFFAGGLIAVGYFAGIVIVFGPQYIPLLRRVFRI